MIAQAVAAPALSAASQDAVDFRLDNGVIEIQLAGGAKEVKRFNFVTSLTRPPRYSLARRFQTQFEAAQPAPNQPNLTERISDAGAFKAPTLRNIELTGPYMHNGSLLTLEAVVEFYARGGHFGPRARANEEDVKTGDQNPAMEPLPLSQEQKADLVAFLKSLTDERVHRQSGPFDHPELKLPLVDPARPSLTGTGNDGFEGETIDAELTIPAVGVAGIPPKPLPTTIRRSTVPAVSKPTQPSRSFEEVLKSNLEY